MTRQKKKQKLSSEQRKLKSSQNTAELTFLEHVHELRKRLFLIVLILVVVSAIGFQYKDLLIGATMAPLHGQKLIYLTPGGGFSFIFTLCLYFGALFTIPFIVHQTYRFLQPIIGKKSRKFVVGFMIVSTLLAAGGALFGYFVTIPAALNFLATFAGDAVTPSLTAESYLNFVVSYVLGLAALFQLPLLLFIFDHVNPLKPGTLSGSQQYVIIGATVLAAVITPTPDAVNMAIVAVPIVVVYELGALAVMIRRYFRHKHHVQQSSVQQFINHERTVDEPFTAILEDLKTPREARSHVETISQPAPIPEPTPTLQVSQLPTAQQTIQSRPRVIDGFSARSRQAPSRVMVPQRPVVSSRPSIASSLPVQPTRQVRSIDGFF